jgi:putative ABC transport system permease protein
LLESGQPLVLSAYLRRGFSARVGTRLQGVDLALVDPDFEKIFAPKVLAGDLHAALTRPDTLALTRETAVKLFGTANAVGKTLQNDRFTYIVAAIVADQPSASTVPFDALGSTASQMLSQGLREQMANNWGFWSGRLYVKLLDGADPRLVLDTIQRSLRASPLAHDFADKSELGGRDLIDYRLGPIADTYLDPDLQDSGYQHASRVAVLGLAAVALLILLLAAANYVNLATVRTLARQREIAMRKVLGASAPAVARQFLAESVLVCLVATAIGLLLAWLLQPVFSDLVQRRFDTMFSPAAIAVTVALAVLLGLAAGAYPAWSALRVRVTAALAGRGANETVRGLWARRTLTVLQFSAAMGLTGTTLAVAWQTHYASTLDPGFDPKQMLNFVTDNDMHDPRTRALRDEIARLPDVAGVAVSTRALGNANQSITSLYREGGIRTDLNEYTVTPEFFDVYDALPVAGRLFHRGQDRMQDRDRLVINAAAARKLGFARPEEAVGKILYEFGAAPHPRQVLGIAPALRHGSAREEQQPAVYFLGDHVGAFTVRARANVDGVREAIEALLPRYFPNEGFEVARLSTVMFNMFYAEDERITRLLAASSVIATGLAAFGIYVLAAYSVRRRE